MCHVVAFVGERRREVSLRILWREWFMLLCMSHCWSVMLVPRASRFHSRLLLSRQFAHSEYPVYFALLHKLWNRLEIVIARDRWEMWFSLHSMLCLGVWIRSLLCLLQHVPLSILELIHIEPSGDYLDLCLSVCWVNSQALLWCNQDHCWARWSQSCSIALLLYFRCSVDWTPQDCLAFETNMRQEI